MLTRREVLSLAVGLAATAITGCGPTPSSKGPRIFREVWKLRDGAMQRVRLAEIRKGDVFLMTSFRCGTDISKTGYFWDAYLKAESDAWFHKESQDWGITASVHEPIPFTGEGCFTNLAVINGIVVDASPVHIAGLAYTPNPSDPHGGWNATDLMNRTHD